jgi:hypothetical protein
MALALLFLTSFNDHGIAIAWKGMDWDVLDRLIKIPTLLTKRLLCKTCDVANPLITVGGNSVFHI